MSDRTRPEDKPAAPDTDTGKRSTVGVYDRPAKADRPPVLPKIIAALLALVMLVLTYLFWPA